MFLIAVVVLKADINRNVVAHSRQNYRLREKGNPVAVNVFHERAYTALEEIFPRLVRAFVKHRDLQPRIQEGQLLEAALEGVK